MSEAGKRLMASANLEGHRLTRHRVFELTEDILGVTEHGDVVTIPAGTRFPVLEDVTPETEGQG